MGEGTRGCRRLVLCGLRGQTCLWVSDARRGGRNPRGHHCSSRDTPSRQGLLPPTVQTRGSSRAKDQNSRLVLFPPMLLGDWKSHLCWTHIPFQGDLLHLALGRGQLCQVAPHWATVLSPQWT